MTINAMVAPHGEASSAILATGSVVQGDWVFAYQTSTDDMFAEARADAYTAGSVAVQRNSCGTSGAQVIGIALNNASSGDTLAVAHEGLFIGVAGGDAVTAGFRLTCAGQSVQDCQVDASGQNYIVGRALTGASAAAKYVLFRLNV